MSYPNTGWKPYGENLKGYMVEINIKESSGMRIEHFIVYTEKAYQQILRTIKKKYGFSYPEEHRVPITMEAAYLRTDFGISEEKKTNLSKEQQEDLEMLQGIEKKNI